DRPRYRVVSQRCGPCSTPVSPSPPAATTSVTRSTRWAAPTPLETASLMVAAAHMTPAEAWRSVGAAARAVLGIEPVQVRVGNPAELLCVEGTDLSDAIARGGERRLVVHRGRVVAEVRVERHLPGWPVSPS